MNDDRRCSDLVREVTSRLPLSAYQLTEDVVGPPDHKQTLLTLTPANVNAADIVLIVAPGGGPDLLVGRHKNRFEWLKGRTTYTDWAFDDEFRAVIDGIVAGRIVDKVSTNKKGEIVRVRTTIRLSDDSVATQTDLRRLAFGRKSRTEDYEPYSESQ